jgi:hypothetical protein
MWVVLLVCLSKIGQILPVPPTIYCSSGQIFLFCNKTMVECWAYILLHVHPLLGNGLVNKFPRKQILGKQSVARLRNNSDNRRSVFIVVRAMPSVTQQNCKHIYNNGCFLWCPCRRFIVDSEGRWQSVIAEKQWVKDTKRWRKGFVKIHLRSVNRH